MENVKRMAQSRPVFNQYHITCHNPVMKHFDLISKHTLVLYFYSGFFVVVYLKQHCIVFFFIASRDARNAMLMTSNTNRLKLLSHDTVNKCSCSNYFLCYTGSILPQNLIFLYKYEIRMEI